MQKIHCKGIKDKFDWMVLANNALTLSFGVQFEGVPQITIKQSESVFPNHAIADCVEVRLAGIAEDGKRSTTLVAVFRVVRDEELNLLPLHLTIGRKKKDRKEEKAEYGITN